MRDKEKIKAEVKRLLNKEWSLSDSTEAKFRREAYKELLEFIDSLPKQPINEDLEVEADAAKLENIESEFGINGVKWRRWLEL